MAENANDFMAGRALMTILGIMALVIGFLAWLYLKVFFFSMILLFGIILTIAGILRLATFLFSGLSNNAKRINAAIGIGALILGILVLVFPEVAGITSILLLAIGFLIWGIGLISFGVVGGSDSIMKILNIIFGVLVVACSVIMMIDPTFGGFTFVFFASLALIFVGIEALAVGIIGKPSE